jgi:hypothetical protein
MWYHCGIHDVQDRVWRFECHHAGFGHFSEDGFFDQVGRRIPPPQPYNLGVQLLLVNTDCSQAKKVVKKGEWYRKEGFRL